MANVKITDLPSAATLDGTELVEMVQDGTSVQGTLANIGTLVGSISAGGSSTQIQYNLNGALTGSSGLTWVNGASRLTTVNITTTGLISSAASMTSGAGFRVPHGVAPTSPTNGDIWTTTAGLFARINGSTQGPFAASSAGGSTTEIQYNNSGAFAGSPSLTWTQGSTTLATVNLTLTGLALTAASGSGSAGIRLPHGSAPSSPTNGDFWSTTSGFFGRVNGSTIGPFGASTAAGSDTQVQYNSSGAFAGSNSFTWNQGSTTLTSVNYTATGLVLTAASGSSSAGIRLPHGSAPSSPTNGDLWTTTAGLLARINGATVGPFGASNVSLSASNAWTKNQYTTPSPLTDGANIAVDASLSNNFYVTLGGNRTLDNPSNLADGMVINFHIEQDGTGSRTLAFGSKYKFSGGSKTLSTAASARDLISCLYDSRDDILLCVLAKAFS